MAAGWAVSRESVSSFCIAAFRISGVAASKKRLHISGVQSFQVGGPAPTHSEIRRAVERLTLIPVIAEVAHFRRHGFWAACEAEDNIGPRCCR